MRRQTRAWVIGLVVFILGAVLNQVSASFIKARYPAAPVLDDLLFDILPYWNVCWLYDLLLVVAIGLALYYVWRFEKSSAPYFLAVLGLVQAARGVFMVLTPFGNPYPGPFNCIFDVESMYYGMMPSGHVAVIFAFYLLARQPYKRAFAALTVTMSALLLLARGHYTIDIVFGLFVSYAIVEFSKQKIRKSLV